MATTIEKAPGLRVDRNALRVNQTGIILFLAIGFILQQPLLVLFTCAVMVIGTAFTPLSLFKQVYLKILRPLKVLRADVHAEDPAPHRFAQGLGGVFLIISLLFFWPLGQFSFIGWALAIVVLVLAAVNLVFSFCLGCFIYFQLQKGGLIRS